MGFWEGLGNFAGHMAKKIGDAGKIGQELSSKSTSELKEMYRHIKSSYNGITDLGYDRSDKGIVTQFIEGILRKRGEI